MIFPGSKTVLTVLSLLVLWCATAPWVYAAEQQPAGTRKENRITTDVRTLSLNEALKDLSRRFSFDIKGIPVGSEVVNVEFDKATLDEALKRLLRGYNYALVKPEGATRGMLLVLSKADRVRAPDVIVATQSPPTAQPAAQTVAQPATGAPVQAGQAALGTGRQRGPGSGATRSQSGAIEAQRAAQGSGSGAASGADSTGGSTSAGGAGAGVALTPPMPPSIAGLDLPPAPPAMPATTSAFGSVSTPPSVSVSVSGSGTASGQPASTSPSSPGGTQSTQTTGSSTLTPPQIPSSSVYVPKSETPASTGTGNSGTVDLRPPQIPF